MRRTGNGFKVCRDKGEVDGIETEPKQKIGRAGGEIDASDGCAVAHAHVQEVAIVCDLQSPVRRADEEGAERFSRIWRNHGNGFRAAAEIKEVSPLVVGDILRRK